MVRPRLLLITPPQSYRTSAYLVAARELDIDLVIASEGEYSLVPELANGINLVLNDSDEAFATLYEHLQQQPVRGVVATDDSVVPLAARVASHLGFIHNNPDAGLYARRKDLARQCQEKAGIPVPAHEVIELDNGPAEQPEALSFPLVIKPLALSGSRGVIRVNTLQEFKDACDRVKPVLQAAEHLDDYERNHVLVEQYIPGQEIAVEAILEKGRLQLLAIFDKPDPLEGPFFEETYYITPSALTESVQKKVLARLQEVCDAYGLVTGPVHAELRINNDGIWLIELAARTIGGQCARLIEMRCGTSLEHIVLLNAIGHSWTDRINTDNPGAAGVLMIPISQHGILRRVEGTAAARKVPGIEHLEISIRDGNEVVPLPEGSSYLGFIFARADTAAEAERALRQAHACLKVVVAPVLPVLRA